jgi:hypothetical protein
MLKKVNNIRAKKREQKMKHKPNKNSGQISQNTSSEESKTTDDSITPQKRKGTIWKILFPDKDIEDDECELERLVCSQVENQIARDLKVIECFKQLKAFESSPEALNMSKVEYTKKKNRISAQLSRERREAIMHSLINVCVTNIKAKRDLNADVEEVKHLLKDTLCSDCKHSLRGKPNPTVRPTTIHTKAACDTKEKRKNPGITITRPGAWGIVMSFAVMACIFTAAFVNMDTQSDPAYSALPETKISDPIRYLKSFDDTDNALALISDQKEFDQLAK